jgi:hypothetical protein
MRLAGALIITIALAGLMGASRTIADQTAPSTPALNKAEVEKHLATWKPKPREAAMKLMQKYGPPQEATATRLIWHANGPWKVTELVNEEIAHDFPVPHVDFLYQAIDHRIDPEHADEVLAYDGSVVLERTKGEIAARCDKEEPNFLAINLAHDIITKKRSVDDARKFYAESMMRLMKEGKPNDYQTGFKFQVAKGDQGDRDKPAAK